MTRRLKIRLATFFVVGLALLSALTGLAGYFIGPAILHPMNLHPQRDAQTAAMLARTGATKENFEVTALDGVTLKGWKVRAPQPNGDWIIVMHGVSDNRTGNLGHAEFLLRNGYSVVMMDSRAHGESGGAMVTYGWLERHDTVAVIDALVATEKVAHLGLLGVSMGAANALQSAAIDPRIEAVVAEDPFANLREVSYDYAGLDVSPLLGKTLFRPASIVAMYEAGLSGHFSPDDVSPEKAVAARQFPVLIICGTNDHRIPCRHAERVYTAAIGPKELWEVPGASHAAALGRDPAGYESRVIAFFRRYLR
jgi:alpha-beta hydrolase superfamily lysophospholipase